MEQKKKHQQTGGGWWIHKIGIIVYMVVIVAFAVQTLELVTWLFPDDNQFMRVVTVFVADGCATGWAMAEMFYRFRLRRSKHLAFGMWIVTFILSTFATAIQMYLSSTHNIPHKIDPTVITVAYGLVILAFVVNIIAITVIIRMEHEAGQPKYTYLDDEPVGTIEQSLQPVAAAQTAQLSPFNVDSEWLAQAIMIRQDQEKQQQTRVTPVQPTTPPMQEAQPKNLLGFGSPETMSQYDYQRLKGMLGEEKFGQLVDHLVGMQNEKPILEEKPGQPSHTRRYGGDPQLEREEDTNPS